MPQVQIQELLQDEQFQGFLEKMVADTVARFVQVNELRAKELSLIERVVRVEEELKSLRKIEAARFEAMEKRFEALQREMNARFEALQREMNARFVSVERRLTFTQWMMGIGFTFLALLITLSNFLLR